MSAGDIPEVHRSPAAMARSLVTYIADPERVQQEVKAQWGSSPSIYEIREMRRRHLKPPQPTEPYRPYEGYYPGQVSDAAAQASAAFLARLEVERAISAASRNALATTQEFAARRWDAQILTARLGLEKSEAA